LFLESHLQISENEVENSKTAIKYQFYRKSILKQRIKENHRNKDEEQRVSRFT